MKKKMMVLMSGMLLFGSVIMAESNILGSSELKRENGWGYWYDANAKKAGVKAEFSNGTFALNVPEEVKKNANSIQLSKIIDLEAGKTYEITFSATVKKEGIIRIGYILNDSPWSTYCISDITVSPEKKTYSCQLRPENFGKDFEKQKSFRFFLGELTDNSICIEKIGISTIE